MDAGAAFLALQPYCVAACKERSASSIDALRDTFDQIPDENLQTLQEYVFFPLKLILKISGSSGGGGDNNSVRPKDKEIESAIHCLCAVLKRTVIRNTEAFVELFTALLATLGHPKNNGRVNAGLSEELKESVVKASELLVLKSDDAVRRSLCSVDLLPLWGHAVATFLSLAEQEGSVDLVVSALHALLTFEIDLPQDEASVCFATFLPGIVVAALKLATRDEKQNHRINFGAVRLLTSSVTLVLSTLALDQYEEVSGRLISLSSSSSSKRSLLVEKTADWRRTTWEKLGVVVDRLNKTVSSHPHWKVRLETLAFVDAVVTLCRKDDYEKHSPTMINSFVEIAVTRLSDENAQVRQAANRVVAAIRTIGGDKLRGVAAESLRRTALTLPQSFRRGCGDAEKLRLILALKGYLLVLGGEALCDAILCSSSLLRKLTLAFLQILDMDVSDLRIIQRLPSNTLCNVPAAQTITSFESLEALNPKIRFRLFTDDRVIEGIEECLQMLGEYTKDNLYLMCDELIGHLEGKEVEEEHYDVDNVNDGNSYEKQVVFMLNHILLGSGKLEATNVNVTNFIKEGILPIYLSSNLLKAAVVADEEKVDSSSPFRFLVSATQSSSLSTTVSRILPRLNSNILLVSLTLRGISVCARTMKAKFRPLLIKALYPVVEHLASEVTLIQDAAYAALGTMATGSGYSSIGELLLQNSDYVVNQLRFELRHNFLLGDHTRRRSTKCPSESPQVLSAMLKNAGPELLPILKDTVEEVMDCLDTVGKYQTENAQMFLKVLAALVFYVRQWFGESNEEEYERREKARQEAASTNKRYSEDYFVEYVKNMEIVDTLRVDEDELAKDGEEEAEEEEDDPASLQEDHPKVLPYNVRVVEEVMTRCIYHLPDENARVRILVLDIMQNCCLALIRHENTLLPLAHTCWSSFVCRLKDKDRFVAIKAFETLVVLSRTCGDFLLRRFSKDVVPALTAFMTSQGRVSAGVTGSNSGGGDAYRFTVAYKLQLAVLRGVGPLCRTIGFKVETGLDKIIDFLLSHLRSSQPTELQDAAKDALIELGSLDPDLIWLRASAARGDFQSPQLRRQPQPLQSQHKCAEYSPDVLTRMIDELTFCDDS